MLWLTSMDAVHCGQEARAEEKELATKHLARSGDTGARLTLSFSLAHRMALPTFKVFHL